MKDKIEIVTCQITNKDTSETHDVAPFYFFPTGFELNTFVKIENVESHLHTDNSRQICIKALALDGTGFVFKLSIDFMLVSVEEEQTILSEITVGGILAVHGCYSVLSDENGGIVLHSPTYSPLPPKYSVTEVEEIFRINNMDNKNRLT